MDQRFRRRQSTCTAGHTNLPHEPDLAAQAHSDRARARARVCFAFLKRGQQLERICTGLSDHCTRKIPNEGMLMLRTVVMLMFPPNDRRKHSSSNYILRLYHILKVIVWRAWCFFVGVTNKLLLYYCCMHDSRIIFRRKTNKHRVFKPPEVRVISKLPLLV